MKKFLSTALITVTILVNANCSIFRKMGMGSGTSTARSNAVQALVTTTRSAVLLMTAAGIAYDAGAFGEPGSVRAEDTWQKIATESIRLHDALKSWSEAIKANKDGTTFQALVSQALAVIGALLPPTDRDAGDVGARGPWIDDETVETSIASLHRPDTFRLGRAVAMGGAR